MAAPEFAPEPEVRPIIWAHPNQVMRDQVDLLIRHAEEHANWHSKEGGCSCGECGKFEWFRAQLLQMFKKPGGRR